MSNMCMQTIGKSVRASFLAVARQGIVLIPFIFILPYFFAGLGIQISQLCSDVVTFIIAIPLQITTLKEMP